MVSAKIAKIIIFTGYLFQNGYINKHPLKRIDPFLDAVNVDIIAFSDDFYKKICKARV